MPDPRDRRGSPAARVRNGHDDDGCGNPLLERLDPVDGRRLIAGIDLNNPRLHDAFTALLALAAAPDGFTVGQLATKVRTMTGRTGYTVRQAAYDLRKIRAKRLVDQPGHTRRYHLRADAARTLTALLALRDEVIAPILAGVRSPRQGRKPKIWTAVDRDYEQLRINLQTLFGHLGIQTAATAA